MSNNEVILTVEGVKRLEDELEELKTVRRQEVAERIKQAIAFGDLSENAEYDEAKNEQAFMEGRILTIEQMLRQARVIDEDDVSDKVVTVGSHIRVLDIEYNEETDYHMVGSAEADPLNGKISNESPMGVALMGCEIGSVVDVQSPDGVVKFKIIRITK